MSGERKGGGARSPRKRTMLTIRSKHAGPGPTLEPTVGDYVSYFENDLGEQWILVRKRGADSASLYGGDLDWKPIDVRARTPKEARRELEAQGLRRTALLGPAIDPLVPGIILDEAERAWLNLAWWTSGAISDDRSDELGALAEAIAEECAIPEMQKHQNSTEYRAAMTTFAFMVGREAGRRGLSEKDAATLMRLALRALPA